MNCLLWCVCVCVLSQDILNRATNLWVTMETDAKKKRAIATYFYFSHLADAFIQSDLQIRKSNQSWKWKLCKY